jgi:hypothetical protein
MTRPVLPGWDVIRQAFLRAGSARVVLTIRNGWEEARIDPNAATSSRYLPESSKGFVVGLVVERLDHALGGDGPFPVVQPGEKGVLLAEWNQYTPSSGTDIAVTSNLASIT